MKLTPLLQSTSASGLGGGASTLSWNHTLGDLGKNGLIIVGAIGKEETGETNPEEIDHITFNGVTMTLVSANRNEFGCSMGILYGDNVPAAGTYQVIVYYKGTGTPNKTRGVCAAFKRVKRISPQEQTAVTNTNDGSPISINVTTETRNALLVVVFGWRVGFAYTCSTGQTEAILNRGDNSCGVVILYQVVPLPLTKTITVNAGNSETEGIIGCSFEALSAGGGALMAVL